MTKRWRRAVALALLVLVAACSGSDPGVEGQDLRVDTESELAWQQHVANLAFADDYEPRCVTPPGAMRRPRVLVTGFGRFLSNQSNATGLMVSELLDTLDYPMTEPPAEGAIDPPGPQTRAELGVMTLPLSGSVDVCAMVLPVFWDLSAVLVLKEIEAFAPDFVLMNGIAGFRQPIWLELGAVNRAKQLDDGSGITSPVEAGAPLISSASDDDFARPQLLSWERVRDAADASIEANGKVLRDGTPLSDVLHGARLAGFPRRSNTYLCNNVTYTVGYLMDHAGEHVRLMEASHPRGKGHAFIDYALEVDHQQTPRVFVHWPSDLRDEHVAAGAAVMRDMIDAQLDALAAKETPSRGTNELADLPSDVGGDTF